MINKQRYYSPLLAEGETPGKIMLLIGLLTKELSPVKRITLLTRKASDKILLENLLKDVNLVKQLGNGIKFPGTAVNMVHYYLGNYSGAEEEILVTIGLNADELLKLEFGHKNKATVAIPWLAGELDKWGKITGAVSLATGNTGDPYPVPDCLLEKALDNIKGINKNTVLHDSDHNIVKSVFTALKENKIYPVPDVVEAYLFLTLGWPKYAIDPVLAILEAVREGRKLKGKVTRTREMYKRWRQECGQP